MTIPDGRRFCRRLSGNGYCPPDCTGGILTRDLDPKIVNQIDNDIKTQEIDPSARERLNITRLRAEAVVNLTRSLTGRVNPCKKELS